MYICTAVSTQTILLCLVNFSFGGGRGDSFCSAIRAWHLSRLSNQDFNHTWVADHTCYGHNPDDIQPFHHLFPSGEDKNDTKLYRQEIRASREKRNAAGRRRHPVDLSYHKNGAEGNFHANSATAIPGRSISTSSPSKKRLNSFSHGTLDPSRHTHFHDKTNKAANRFAVNGDELRERLAKVRTRRWCVQRWRRWVLRKL